MGYTHKQTCWLEMCNNFWLSISQSGFLWAALCLSGFAQTCQAEIIVDSSLGTERTELIGPNFNVSHELGKLVDRNLFHSFEKFNLDGNQSASFTGPPTIKNILSRVTGGTSTINGLLSSKIQGANLFFLNPAGIIFGSEAKLDISGAFYATTADFIRLDDGKSFVAKPPGDDALLTSKPPAAFGFLPNVSERKISIENAWLSNPIPPAESLSFVGGQITITNTAIESPSTTVNIISAGGPGEAKIQGDLIELEEGQKRGSITIKDFSEIVTSGADGGHTHIVGGAVVIEDLFILANNQSANRTVPRRGIKFDVDNLELVGSSFFTGPSSDAPQSLKGGNIEISASGTVTLVQSTLNSIAGDQSNPNLQSAQAGNIEISTRNLKLYDNSTLIAENMSKGLGGNITIMATDTVHMDKSFIGSPSISGEAGVVSVKASNINLTNKAIISVNIGISEAGKINLTADRIALDKESKIKSNAIATGDAGEVSIITDTLELHSGAAIEGKATSSGKGANVNIVAREAVTIGGESTSINSDTSGSGNAGSITITTDKLTIADRARLTASTSDRGAGGNIKIVAGRFVVQDGGEVSATTSIAAGGGNIDIQATDLQLRDRGSISAKSTGTGKSGSIDIKNADTVSLLDNSEITVTTDKGDAIAGNITINAKTLVHLRNQSAIETSAAVNDPNGRGIGGNITIDPKIVVLDGASKILAKAQKGKGGNIKITITDGGALFKSPDSVIDASAGPAGIDGTVEIIRTDSDVVRGSLVLPESFLDAAKLLSEKCMARTAADASSFVVSGRSGVPPGPDALLPDYVSVLDEEQPEGGHVGETAYTLPVSGLGSTQNRLSRLIIECNPI